MVQIQSVKFKVSKKVTFRFIRGDFKQFDEISTSRIIGATGGFKWGERYFL